MRCSTGRGRTPRRPGPTNAEFHKATIDNLPLADASADCIISNCVINLAPDKRAVFREMARVLKPGGRVAVSDIALKKPLPPEIGQDLLAYVGCIAGAIPIEEYREGLKEAGFAHVEIIDSGADLNAYAQIEGQVGCCGGEMVSEPEPVSHRGRVVLHACSCRELGVLHAGKARRHRRSLLHDRGEGGGERRGGLVLLRSGRVEDARAHHAARRARPPLRHQRLCGEREGLRRQAPLTRNPMSETPKTSPLRLRPQRGPLPDGRSVHEHARQRAGLSRAGRVSAGTEAGTRINPLAVEAMGELGISMEGQAPSSSRKRWRIRRLASSRWAAGSMPPRARPESTSRRIGASMTRPGKPIEKVREIRDQIRERVEAMLSEM